MATATRIPQSLLELVPRVEGLAKSELAQAVEIGKLVEQAVATLTPVKRRSALVMFAKLFCDNGNVVEQYSFGDCFELAFALRRLTGKDVATCHTSCQPSSVANGCHSFLILNEHTALDISGKHRIKDLLRVWAGEMKLICNSRAGEEGQPSFSVCNVHALYSEWGNYDTSTTSDQHLFAARQLLRAYGIPEKVTRKTTYCAA